MISDKTQNIPGRNKIFLLTSDSLTGRDILLNGRALQLTPENKLPPLRGDHMHGEREIVIPKTSYGFITLKDQCRK